MKPRMNRQSPPSRTKLLCFTLALLLAGSELSQSFPILRQNTALLSQRLNPLLHRPVDTTSSSTSTYDTIASSSGLDPAYQVFSNANHGVHHTRPFLWQTTEVTTGPHSSRWSPLMPPTTTTRSAETSVLRKAAPRSASSSTTPRSASAAVRQKSSFKQGGRMWTSAATILRSSMDQVAEVSMSKVLYALDAVQTLLAAWWWLTPMILAVAPVYRFVVHNAITLTPSFWPMTCMEYIRQSPDALLVVSCFLLSNLSFFVAAACFFRLSSSSSSQQAKQSTKLEETTNNSNTGVSNSFSNSSSRVQYNDLALWILACGLVSTIFHSLQALGTTALAEAACYVDHGVAGTTFCYFWQVCGVPRRKRVLVTGAAGLAALSMPLNPGYSWLHGLWHGLASLSAYFWGLQKQQTWENQSVPVTVAKYK